MILVFKDERGDQHEFEVEQLVSVDGQPFQPEVSKDLEALVHHLSGRMEVLEGMVQTIVSRG